MEATKPSEIPETGTFRKVGFPKIILLLESKESDLSASHWTGPVGRGAGELVLRQFLVLSIIICDIIMCGGDAEENIFYQRRRPK